LVAEQPGHRIVYLGWDLRQSDFPLRVSFPIFIANCLDWLSGYRQRAQAMNIRTGQPVRIPVPSGLTTVTLHTPDGTTRDISVTGDQTTIDPLSRVGIYRVTAAGLDFRFAVNLLDARESRSMPQDRLLLEGQGGTVATSTPGPVRTEREYWRVLLLLALVLLCLEWWIFHRRIG
jgi:hypothetical protein